MKDMTLVDGLTKMQMMEAEWPLMPIEERREIIEAFYVRVEEGALLAPFDTKKATSEHFGFETYGREVNVPAGVAMVGAMYREPQINVMTKGKLFLATAEKIGIVEAPCIYTSDPNTRKVGYIIEDMQWITVVSRPRDETDAETIMDVHVTDFGGR